MTSDVGAGSAALRLLRVGLGGVLAASVVVLLGCGGTQRGIEVELQVEHTGPGSDAHPGEPRSFTTDLGYDVELTAAYLTVQSVELHDCPSSVEGIVGALSPVGIAHAHEPGTPTLLGDPSVESLLGADGSPVTLGTLEPPPGSYCHVDVTLGPADDDAARLPTDVDMVSKTAALVGSYIAPGGDTPTPWSWTLTDPIPVTLDLGLDELQMSGSHRQATLVISADAAGWLEGVDFASDSPSAVDALLRYRIEATLAAHP